MLIDLHNRYRTLLLPQDKGKIIQIVTISNICLTRWYSQYPIPNVSQTGHDILRAAEAEAKARIIIASFIVDGGEAGLVLGP